MANAEQKIEPGKGGDIEAAVPRFRRVADEQVRMQIGKVVSVNGARVLMMVDLPPDQAADYMPRIGETVCIETARADIVASVTGLSSPSAGISDDDTDILIAELAIIGEFASAENGSRSFRRGITAWPTLGEIAASLTLEDRAVLYGTADERYYRVGDMADDSGLPAMIDADGLLNGNFAVVGMPGVGKSCAVASIVRTLLQNRHPCRTVIVDVNDEYAGCFGKVANVMKFGPGSLPHWMLSFREFVQLMVGNGRPADDEIELLAEAVCAARRRFLQANPVEWVREGTEISTVNVDMPLPYRFSDLVSYLDRSSHTDQRFASETFRRLRSRLVSTSKDPQFHLFFGSSVARDTLSPLLSRLFRFPIEGKPVTVLQLGGQSARSTEIVVSAVARYMQLIGAAIGDSVPFMLVLEEAHRFLPENRGDAPLSSRTLGRLIEKAGRTNVSVGMVTSEPRELGHRARDHCATLFAMRLASAGDMESVETFTPESAADALSGISVLGKGEAIGIGQGVPVPVRFTFRQLPAQCVPSESSRAILREGVRSLAANADARALQDMLNRWRYIADRNS